MSITIREVKTKADCKQFVDFQFELYKGNTNWAPPMKADEIKSLHHSTNPAFEFCDAKFWLAFEGNKCVGRIGAIINTPYIEKIEKKIGRISRLEFINNKDILAELLKVAENWLKEKGMTEVHGPLGFSNLDTQGMLIEGFNHLQSIASVYHHPYYKEMIESFGYEKEIDWLEFRLTIGEAAVNKASRGAKLIAKRYGIEVMHFTKISELLPHTNSVFQLLNDSYHLLPFVTKFSDKMIAYYREKYIKLLNPEFVKFVKMKGEIIGFLIGIPSLSKAMQKAGGKLFPFGFWHILQARAAKNNDTMDQMLTGVKTEHQATGAAVILMAELQNVMISKGMKYIETTGIFETNTSAISNWKNYEHIQHKRRRCFVKKLV